MKGLRPIQSVVRANAYLLRPESRTAMQMADDDLFINDGKNVTKYYADYAPYMSRALEIMTSRAYVECIVVGSSRSAKTKTVLEAFINWSVRVAAGDMFIYCSTQTKANEFGSKDIDRCVMNTPQLNELAIFSKEKWKIAEKTFKTMNIKLGSATTTTTSASGYKSVICTDYDRSDDDIGTEGNKFELMAGRTTSLGSAAMAAAESSPARQVRRLPKGVSNHYHPVPDENQGIAGLYNQGTMERFYWRCRDCKSYFIPTFELLTWVDAESIPETAQNAKMMCPHCACCYENKDKAKMNAAAIDHGKLGYFQAHQIDDSGNETGLAYIHNSRGSTWFDGCVITARAWSKLVERHLMGMKQFEMFGDESTLKAFNNTYLGRNYVMQAGYDDDIEVSWLIERARVQSETFPYTHGIIPADAAYLIMSVDVQNGRNSRFVCQATAFSADGLRMYIVDRFQIMQDQNGDRINPARELDSWKLLIDQVIKKTYPIQGSDETMRAVKTVCDMGGTNDKTKNISTSTTEIAYQFVKYLETEQLKCMFELTKGAARHTMKGFYNYSNNDNSGHKDACPYLEMNGNMLSNSIRSAITRKGNSGLLIVLPFWMKGTPKQEWFDEIIAEEQDSAGLWFCSKSARNEAVDCTKMALATSQWLNDMEEKDHQNDASNNPYIALPHEHIFGLPVSGGLVVINNFDFSSFGSW